MNLCMADRLDPQQSQQNHATQQMHCHDCGKQLHRDRQCAECSLQAHPDQSCHRPPNRQDVFWLRWLVCTLLFTARQPGDQRQGQDQYAYTGGKVAVDHFYPGLERRDRASRHCTLRGLDMQLRTHRTGAAIATRPVGAAQPRICQPGECTKNHQVKCQEQGHERQHTQTLRNRSVLVAHPDPGQRPKRHHKAHDHQAQSRAKVVEILRSHV